MTFGPMSENFKIRVEKRRALMAAKSGQHPSVVPSPPVIPAPPVVTHDVSADTAAAQAHAPTVTAPPPAPMVTVPPVPKVKVFPGTQTVCPPPPSVPMAAPPVAAELPNPWADLRDDYKCHP